MNDMSPIIQRLLRTCHVGRTKCCLSTLLWSIATWVVISQVYQHVPSPSRADIAEGHHAQQRDVPSEIAVSRPALKDVISVGRDSSPVKGSAIKIQHPLDLLTPKKHTRNRAEEEAKLQRLRKLVGLGLFPSKELTMGGSKCENLSEVGYYYPGREWRDTAGNPIQAHGGGIMYVPDSQTFYWYGENKGGPTYHLTKRGTARVSSSNILVNPAR